MSAPRYIFIFLCLILALLLIPLPGCRKNYTPKPSGYIRIDLPEKKYILYDTVYPFRFEYPVYSIIKPDTGRLSEPGWINILFPSMGATIHISYKKVRNNLNSYIEDSRKLAYKHTIKADAIKEIIYSSKEHDVTGLLYEIKGNAASSVQFYLTDSTSHFLRGSLYFNTEPNADSLAPVINYLKSDIIHLMETCEWKYQ